MCSSDLICCFLTAREIVLEAGKHRLMRHSPARHVERGAFELERLEGRLRQVIRNMMDKRLVDLALTGERLRREFGPARMLALRAELDCSRAALDQAAAGFLRARETAALSLDGRLAALDPQAPLAREYTLMRDNRGRLVADRKSVV